MAKKSIADRYFIAIVPPSPFYTQANELKEYFKAQHHSKASLNSPPHITLHMPFEWRSDREDILLNKLGQFSSRQSPVDITFNNFNCFEPRVIFIAVAENKGLNELQYQLRVFCKKDLGLFNADYKDLPFHPHLTLAFRDLKKPAFAKAWEEFKDKKFEGTFSVDKICLLKHENEKWRVMKELGLKN
ncbi:MAG: 2'-5' RNA ligase family protein [Bacteroidota bacterium]